MAGQSFLSLVGGIATRIFGVQVGGSGSANAIPALSASGLLDITMMPAGIGATTVVANASEALAAGALVSLWSNAGVLAVRNADQTSTAKFVVGYVLGAVASGASATVYLSGIITGLTGLTIGATEFLGTVGAVTPTAPTTAGYISQQVGVALTATTMLFEPEPQIAM